MVTYNNELIRLRIVRITKIILIINTYCYCYYHSDYYNIHIYIYK